MKGQMTKDQLISKGCIVPMSIQEAFDTYPYQIVQGDLTYLKEQVYSRIRENGIEASYLDFYYGSLKAEEKDKVHQYLTKEENVYLKAGSWDLDPKEVYYPYQEKLFEIALKLSYYEILFSTFYFSKQKETLWTNWNHQMIIFRGLELL